jgi:hypothetical protein
MFHPGAADFEPEFFSALAERRLALVPIEPL